jgi:hypothetical protein
VLGEKLTLESAEGETRNELAPTSTGMPTTSGSGRPIHPHSVVKWVADGAAVQTHGSTAGLYKIFTKF